MECEQLTVAQRTVVGSVQVDVEHDVGGPSVSGLRGSRDVYYAKHGNTSIPADSTHARTQLSLRTGGRANTVQRVGFNLPSDPMDHIL